MNSTLAVDAVLAAEAHDAVFDSRRPRTRTRNRGRKNALPSFHSELIEAKRAETCLTFCLSEDTEYSDENGCFDAVVLIVDTYAIKVRLCGTPDKLGEKKNLWIGKRFIVSVSFPAS